MASVFCRALLVPVAGLALLASPALAQRPALTGEKARVAEAVRTDLTKLADLQKAHHARTKVYAADARDLNFAPTSGAQVNIAYASMNAWAANATHPVLSPIACFIIISAAEPTGPASEPFCQEGRPGVTASAASTAPAAAPAAATPAPQQARQTQTAAQPTGSQPTQAPPSPGTVAAGAAAPPPTVTRTPTQPAAAAPAPTPATTPPAATPARTEQSISPSTPAAPVRTSQVSAAPAGPPAARGGGQISGDIPVTARSNTREALPAGAIISQQVENVTAAQFSQKLAEFAQGAMSVFLTQPTDAVRIVRDPYESTAEFEARRAAAIAAAQRREQEFFQQNARTYNVAMPIRDVRYDADREVLEFTVDGVGLPITRTYGDEVGAPTLSLTCYTRPVFWCSPDTGMSYEAGDLWRVSRAAARQHDVLRNPLVLYARFAVGRREDTRTLAISLLSMDLQARGQSVQRWEGGAR